MGVWTPVATGRRRFSERREPPSPRRPSQRSNAPSAGLAYHKSVDIKTLSE